MSTYHNKGFTLVEISIILVIIGLIIGGILTGKDLIQSAALRSLIADINNAETVVNTFEETYAFLPGDLPTASTYWPTETNGNGNGIIDYTPERWQAWKHAYAAEMLRNLDVDNPPRYYLTTYKTGVVSVFQWNWNQRSGLMYQFGGAPEGDAILTPVQAQYIDQKMDDGKYASGKLSGLNGAGATSNCNAGGAYILTNPEAVCRIFYFPSIY